MAIRTRQAAEFLRTSATQVMKLINSGRLKAHKHADNIHWLIEIEDLARFIIYDDYYRKRFAYYKPKTDVNLRSYQLLIKEANKLV